MRPVVRVQGGHHLRDLVSPALSRGVLGAVVVLGTLAMAGDASAALCDVRPVTTTTKAPGTTANTNIDPRLSRNGRHLVFGSNADLTGGNPDRNGEIFRYDTLSGAVSQLTDTAEDPPRRAGLGHPSISNDGTKLVFDSVENVGQVSPDGSNDVYLVDLAGSGPLRDLTPGTERTGYSPTMSTDGRWVAFESYMNIEGHNPSGYGQVWLADTTTGELVQITEGSTGSGNPSISADGSRIAFSRSLGGTRGGLSSQVFLWERATGAIRQVTSSDVDSFGRPGISSDGTHVVYSRFTRYPSSPFYPLEDREAYLADLGTGAINQLTVNTGNRTWPSPVVNGNGSRVAFSIASESDDGGTPAGPAGVYLYSQPGGTRLATYVAQYDLDALTIDDAGRWLALATTNRTPTNPDGNDEIYLAECASAVPSFSDVDPQRATYSDIEWAADEDVMSGYRDGTFDPRGVVRRARAAVVLYAFAGRPAFVPPRSPSFSDYPSSRQHYLEVEWAAANGLLPVSRGPLRPSVPFTREDAARALYVFAQRPAFEPPSTPTFSDVSAGHRSHVEIEWLAAADGLLDPEGDTFRPTASLKRQHLADFLHGLRHLRPAPN